jgi:hypothetical protein
MNGYSSAYTHQKDGSDTRSRASAIRCRHYCGAPKAPLHDLVAIGTHKAQRQSELLISHWRMNRGGGVDLVEGEEFKLETTNAPRHREQQNCDYEYGINGLLEKKDGYSQQNCFF